MKFSKDTMDSIRKFASIEAVKHLNDSEISYIEQLNRKTNNFKNKFKNKLDKFKLSSKQSKEIQEDFIIYMSDYMTDLIDKGHSEEEALEIAKTNLASNSQSDESEYLKNKYTEYYLSRDPQMDEIIGLYYGGFTLIGLTLGIVIGIILSFTYFKNYFWVTIGVSTILGIILGVGMGLLKNASLVNKYK